MTISSSLNSRLCDRVTDWETQCWANNQYSSRLECLEITGLPENLLDNELETLILKVLAKIGINIDLASMEDCFWVKIQDTKNVIIKFSRASRMLIKFKWR